MPILLDQKDVESEVDGCESVLIVPCRFCPAASMAVKNNESYIAILRNFLKTASYERHIERMKRGLEKRGIRTGVFRSRLLHQFVLCMWTPRRRRKLLERASRYDALVVLGCESAVQTVRDSVKSSSCRVIEGMSSRGVMSVTPELRFPADLRLGLDSVCPVAAGPSAAASGEKRT